jgi:Tol biopolymer transport system component
MKMTFLFPLLLIIPLLSGGQNINYLNQSTPGLKAKLFNQGKLVEHPNGHIRSFNVSFSPNGKELFFSYYKATKENPDPTYEIKTYKFLNGKWIGPKTAAFSGIYSDVDINFSPDGNYIFFSSDRQQPNSIGLDIYYCVKTNNGWSDPIYAGTNINTNEGEVYPSVSKKKNIFFRSNRQGGYGDDDIYRAEWVNGNFINVKNLGPNINSVYSESNSVIAPDESYILFCTSRPETNNIQHIYISFQIGDNIWTKAVSVGDKVNTDAGAGAPTLSPDGNYLFFKKTQIPQRGIYWISTEIFKPLKPKK